MVARGDRGGFQQVLVSSSFAIRVSVANILYSMISYPNYKFIFPIMALGMFAEQYGDEELL